LILMGIFTLIKIGAVMGANAALKNGQKSASLVRLSEPGTDGIYDEIAKALLYYVSYVVLQLITATVWLMGQVAMVGLAITLMCEIGWLP